MTLQAVILDLGGVVLDSPLDAIAAFEDRNGLPSGTVNGLVTETGAAGAWACHERGELARERFLTEFAAEFAARGLDVDTAQLMAEIDASIRVRPRMLQAVDRVRAAGFGLAALTNNWNPFGSDGLATHFDTVVESVVEGTRKPERRIYEICLERLGMRPEACIMLDDLGPNLKPARAMGMRTVKVVSEDHALAVLDDLIG